MFSQFEILEDLKDSSDDYQYVVLGTYNFDPDFFELKVLPIFRTKDAETILVLTDKKEYQDRFSDMSSAGQEYYIDYCFASQIFHPKFILLIWSEGIKLILGSANLTKQAWFESGEIMGNLTYYFAEPDAYNKKILSDFASFLSKILEKNYVKSQKHRLKLSEIIEKLPKGTEDDKSNVKLIYNIEKPILEQVKAIINESIISVKILAPFFNVAGSVFEFLEKNGCNKYEIFIQPSKVSGFPKEKINQMISKGNSINLNQIYFKNNENRFIHAKLMIIKTTSKEYCLYGSANPTFAGMLATPENGNLELCILVSNHKKGYFDSLIENEDITVSKLKLEQITEINEDFIHETESKPINIVDSYLEEKNLILEIDKVPLSFKIILAHLNDEFLEIPFQTNKNFFKITLNNDQFNFCSRPTYVQIQIKKNDQIIKSNKRWISTQTLELTPRKMDIERIQKTGGRFGLISFLNKLEKYADDPQWFYYFLQRVRFEKLGSLEPVRRKILQRKLDSEEDKEYEKPPETDLANTFKVKFEKRNNSIRDSLKQITEFNVEEFEKQFNQFLTWSKVVIWFTLRDEKFIDNLRFIRANIEEFLILHQKLKHDRNFVNHLNKILFWQHLFFLCFLAYVFQKKIGFLKKNPGVVRVFTETTSMLLNEFEAKTMFLMEDFEPISKEYSEFENLEINLDNLARFYSEKYNRIILETREENW